MWVNRQHQSRQLRDRLNATRQGPLIGWLSLVAWRVLVIADERDAAADQSQPKRDSCREEQF